MIRCFGMTDEICQPPRFWYLLNKFNIKMLRIALLSFPLFSFLSFSPRKEPHKSQTQS